MVALDVSPKALSCAQANASRLGLEAAVQFCEQDIAGYQARDRSVMASFDAIVSNPPYIPTALLEVLPAEVREYEPLLALDGGADGLKLAREIAHQARTLLKPGGLLALELHEDCLEAATALALSLGYEQVNVEQDLTRRPRFLTAQRPGLDGALEALQAGHCLVLPTDTVYGLGLLATVNAQPERLFQLKQRPPEKGIPLLIGSCEELELYGRRVPAYAQELARKHWPGALTLVVLASEAVPPQFVSPDGSVALRVPAHPLALALIRAAGVPLAMTSANRSGQPPVHALEQVDEALLAGVAQRVDGGTLPDAPASTVVSCLDAAPVVLRQGAIFL
jgi:tRNA threonylcarbamoyl adenosine modification protein (Sua5/YciO/YrdC/YwlC family)